MSNIIPQTDSSSSSQPATGVDRFSKPEMRAMTCAQNAEIARGSIVASRVHSTGMVTVTAIQMTGMISREAQFLADGDPAAAARLNHLADRYAEYATWEIRQYRNG